MSKELVERHIQAMVDEAIKSADFDKLDRATIEVMRRHIAVLESRQASLKTISLAISDALRELWWSAGTDARRRIDRVGELALEIRNEESITVEPFVTLGSAKPSGGSR
jgi:hypothetical protein